MESNKFIPENKWEVNQIINLPCLYGYSHKSKGWYPYKIITEIIEVGKKKNRIGIKGFAENEDRLYVQIQEKYVEALREKGWLNENR